MSKPQPSSTQTYAPDSDEAAVRDGQGGEASAAESGASDQGDNQEAEQQTLSADLKRAIVGGVVAAVVALAGTLAVGNVGGGEAQVLLRAMIPTTRAFASTVMIASATVIALMLTLLSLSASTTSTLRPIHYHRIRHIAQVDVAVFITATVFLLLLNLPLEQADKVPVSFFDVMYYVSVSVSAALGGAVVAIVLMLYHTVREMIRVVGPGEESTLIADEEEEQR